MIAHITGQLFRKTTQSVIIEAGGIGYEVFVPLSTFYALPEQDETVSLHIYTHVREDALLLFGFSSRLEKELFLMLISVSGIGPKLAVNILSGIGPQELLDAMAKGDANRLQTIPGVGKKTAERIVLELKEKAIRLGGEREEAQGPAAAVDDALCSDALSALVNLGYSAKAAKKAVDKARQTVNNNSLELLIKEALRVLS
ncbi:MAG: Holliday junction branch migration protein RuvA [Deltaproteobacteria bacterium]|nr:Holliday junction branch migration protein RuvA [Deltaproteobacteria bacterium]MBW1928237.1 Holliday junction branch migration protein RuvA [Deltaproteobacteria bacterium]MBW2026782.1 Holliday junction branch migration protein RuvA [Deltaproteobacteria bacterium]MBW2127457.1 Holliday junction branch migration protein RuvA [Deltaproteobacteria bacterium]